MWDLDHKGSWEPKNWCFQTVALEKTFDSLLDSKKLKPVNPKGNQPWIFTGSTNATVDSLWPSDVKSWFIGKTLMLGKIEGRRRREQQRMRWLDGITDSMAMSFSERQEIVKDREHWRAAAHRMQNVGHNWATEQQEQRISPCVLLALFRLFLNHLTPGTEPHQLGVEQMLQYQQNLLSTLIPLHINHDFLHLRCQFHYSNMCSKDSNQIANFLW